MKHAKTIFTIRSMAAFFAGEERLRRWLDTVKSAGFDAVALDVAWEMAERTRGKFDFSPFDRLADEVAERGMGVQLKANSRLSPRWISPKYAQRLCDGSVARSREVFDRPAHTFCNASLNASIADFFHALARHYASRPVVSVQPFFAFAFETEYEYYQYADYSAFALAEFRKWLARRYHSPRALNRAWGTRFSSFARAQILFDGSPPPQYPDRRPLFTDFMEFREEAMKNFIGGIAAAVKSAAPNLKFALQVGRIFSPCAARRATAGVFWWGKDADEIIVDPAPCDRIGFAADALRMSGKTRSVELDGPYVYQRHYHSVGHKYVEQAAEAARHGAERLYVANFVGPQETARYAKSLAEAVEAFHATRALKPAAEPLFISKWDVYGFHEMEIPAYRFAPPDGSPLAILTEDLASDK